MEALTSVLTKVPVGWDELWLILKELLRHDHNPHMFSPRLSAAVVVVSKPFWAAWISRRRLGPIEKARAFQHSLNPPQNMQAPSAPEIY